MSISMSFHTCYKNVAPSRLPSLAYLGQNRILNPTSSDTLPVVPSEHSPEPTGFAETLKIENVQTSLALTPDNGKQPLDSQPEKKKRKVAERDWLPQGWLVEGVLRKNGKLEGHTDYYYFSPVNEKYRSKTEVLYFLVNGTRKPKKKPMKGVPPSDQNGLTYGKKKRRSMSLEFDPVMAECAEILVSLSRDTYFQRRC